MSDDPTRGLRRDLDATFDEASIRAKAAAMIAATHSGPAKADGPSTGASSILTDVPEIAAHRPTSDRRRRGWVWPTAAFGLAAAFVLVVVLARAGSTNAPVNPMDSLAQAAASVPAVPTGDALIWNSTYTDVRDEVITRHDRTITQDPAGTTIETSREFPLVGNVSRFVPGDATTERLPSDAPVFGGFTAAEIRDLPTDPDDLVADVRSRSADDTAAALTLMELAATGSLEPDLRAAAVRGLGVLGGVPDGYDQDPYDLTGAVVVGPDLAWIALIDPDTGTPRSFVADPTRRDPTIEDGRWTFWTLDPLPPPETP